mmetsp:Transcript_9335/g.24029  ORF Transcript_9335/g.24029 Transcript_9335/m.24029 type:complete len:205 (-) Transcript_9335:18-632(-)
MQPLLRTSHTFTLVSSDPLARYSPKGWKSTDWQLERWPVSVRTTLASSRSQILTVPLCAPATTTSSALSKVTQSTGLWWPDRLKMAFGLPMAHTLTFRSSPPVTSTPEDLRPIFRQFTLEEWATNSCSLYDRLGILASLLLEGAPGWPDSHRGASQHPRAAEVKDWSTLPGRGDYAGKGGWIAVGVKSFQLGTRGGVVRCASQC